MAWEPIFKDGEPLFIEGEGGFLPAVNEDPCDCCGDDPCTCYNQPEGGGCDLPWISCSITRTSWEPGWNYPKCQFHGSVSFSPPAGVTVIDWMIGPAVSVGILYNESEFDWWGGGSCGYVVVGVHYTTDEGCPEGTQMCYGYRYFKYDCCECGDCEYINNGAWWGGHCWTPFWYAPSAPENLYVNVSSTGGCDHCNGSYTLVQCVTPIPPLLPFGDGPALYPSEEYSPLNWNYCYRHIDYDDSEFPDQPTHSVYVKAGVGHCGIYVAINETWYETGIAVTEPAVEWWNARFSGQDPTWCCGSFPDFEGTCEWTYERGLMSEWDYCSGSSNIQISCTPLPPLPPPEQPPFSCDDFETVDPPQGLFLSIRGFTNDSGNVPLPYPDPLLTEQIARFFWRNLNGGFALERDLDPFGSMPYCLNAIGTEGMRYYQLLGEPNNYADPGIPLRKDEGTGDSQFHYEWYLWGISAEVECRRPFISGSGERPCAYIKSIVLGIQSFFADDTNPDWPPSSAYSVWCSTYITLEDYNCEAWLQHDGTCATSEFKIEPGDIDNSVEDIVAQHFIVLGCVGAVE